MKLQLALLLTLFFSLSGSYAQSLTSSGGRERIEVTRTDLSSTLIPPGKGESASILPDAPPARSAGRICRVEIQGSCDSWERRLYWPRSLARHDESWGKAMMNPAVFTASSLLLASFITDYKTTRYCVDRRLGREANPLLGQHRAQELTVGLSLTAVSIWAVGVAKKNGDGHIAIVGESMITILHALASAHNAVVCGY